MAKRRSRKPFQTAEKPIEDKPEKLIDTTIGVFSFFKDYGIRETVESVIVAVILALMFRAYEAEAFIIPTGSMAPTLQGQHMDVVCEECGYQYRAGASESSSTTPPSRRADVTKTYCPICRHGMVMRSNRNPDHVSNNGDRILVNKFVYDFQSPERFDVIVFKNPNNGKQNYIKRLIGLPGDKLLLENGDIYNFVADESGALVKQIVRKPYDKVPVMLQLVDDSAHIATSFKRVEWPVRWSEWKQPEKHWRKQEASGKLSFVNSGDSKEMNWLRYRHLVPRSPSDEIQIGSGQRGSRPVDTIATDWDEIQNGEVPSRIKSSRGSLIRDYYEYNDRAYRARNRNYKVGFAHSSAAHWVGDLGVEFELQVKSESGLVAFDLVEGGIHFQCTINVENGEASLEAIADDGDIMFDAEDGKPVAQTSLKGSGNYKIRYVHIDDMVYLWVNNKYVEFNGSSYTRKSSKRPVPRYSESDPGDAEPIGIGTRQCAVTVDRAKVFRDVYYVAPEGLGNEKIENETGFSLYDLITIYENPQRWNSSFAKRLFQRPVSNDPVFTLEADQYFPMGDNSPASSDARVWNGPKYVEEEFLIGRAMFIYWPHSLNSPIKHFPNFKRMGFIR